MRPLRASGLGLGVALGLAWSLPAAAQGLLPAGPTFVVSSPNGSFYTLSSVALARAADGSALVSWSGSSASSGPGIQARRLAADGGPVGGQFQVNTYTTGSKGPPAVAVAADGSVLVVWSSRGSTGSDTSGASVQSRWVDASGPPVGADRQLNVFTAQHERPADVVLAPGGEVVVAWASTQGSSGKLGLPRGRRLGVGGDVLGGELQLSQSDTSTASLAGLAFAPDPEGGFLSVWPRSDTGDPSVDGIRVRRFGAHGIPITSEIQVSSYAPGTVDRSRIVTLHDGFAVVWQTAAVADSGGDGSGSGIRMRRLDAQGLPLGTEREVNVNTSGNQDQPNVASTGAGGFMVVWNTKGLAANPTTTLTLGRRVGEDGMPLAGEFWLVDGPKVTGRVEIRPGPDDDLLAAWPCGAEVCTRRFVLADALAFADGFESGAPSFWTETGVVLPPR